MRTTRPKKKLAPPKSFNYTAGKSYKYNFLTHEEGDSIFTYSEIHNRGERIIFVLFPQKSLDIPAQRISKIHIQNPRSMKIFTLSNSRQQSFPKSNTSTCYKILTQVTQGICQILLVQMCLFCEINTIRSSKKPMLILKSHLTSPKYRIRKQKAIGQVQKVFSLCGFIGNEGEASWKRNDATNWSVNFHW